MRFYVPPTLQRDFTDSLNSPLGTDAIVNFDSKNVIRIRIATTNHRVENRRLVSDEVVFAEITSGLKFGDYLQYNNGVFLINKLRVDNFPKCYEFNTTVCNAGLNITRYKQVVYDNLGNVITPEGDSLIVSNIYCSITNNNFQFQTNLGSIGIIPNDQVEVKVQYNEETKEIAIGDNFYWFKDKYQIANINYSQIDINGISGILIFYGKKLTDDVAV